MPALTSSSVPASSGAHRCPGVLELDRERPAREPAYLLGPALQLRGPVGVRVRHREHAWLGLVLSAGLVAARAGAGGQGQRQACKHRDCRPLSSSSRRTRAPPIDASDATTAPGSAHRGAPSTPRRKHGDSPRLAQGQHRRLPGAVRRLARDASARTLAGRARARCLLACDRARRAGVLVRRSVARGRRGLARRRLGAARVRARLLGQTPGERRRSAPRRGRLRLVPRRMG